MKINPEWKKIQDEKKKGNKSATILQLEARLLMGMKPFNNRKDTTCVK